VFGLQFAPVLARFPELMAGLGLTLGLSAVAIACGTSLGLLAAWGRTMGPKPLKWVIGLYVELVRNTPFLVQLYIIFLGLPAAGFRLPAVQAGILAMTINLGAYSIEIFRAGIESIHRSQIEAGLALALTRVQIFRHVILQQAVARVWPSLVSQFILMVLTSSVCSFISVEELSGAAYTIQSDTFRSFEVYILVGAIYLAIAVFLKIGLAVLGGRLFGRKSAIAATLETPIGAVP
jgi:polar amino acid transport system permease protein